MKKKVTWILVANGARGQLYASDGNGAGIRPAEEQVCRPVYEHEPVLSDDDDGDSPRWARPTGRAFQTREQALAAHGINGPARPGLPPFAASIARTLEQGLNEKKFDRLVLVAPPQALGELKGAMSTAVRSRLACEIGRDLTQASCFELPKYLGRSLAGR